MALCYLPCFGDAGILLRSAVNGKRSDVPCNTFPTNILRCHCRRHIQVNLKPTRITASVAQSDRPAVTSGERPSESSLVNFSFASSPVDDEDGVGVGVGVDGEEVEDDVDVAPREQLRRDRISKANTGKVPWNKGRRHSPETIAKIKERTKNAMLDPKIRDKLRQYGKSQTPETKAKIREKMAGFWEVKRMIRESQVSLESEWKELVAEAARVGDSGEDELEWDSYKKIKEQWRLEEMEEERRRKLALRDSRKAERRTRKPIIEAHRKAISDAIRAKWADPEYQARVFAGIAKAEKRRKSSSTEVKQKAAPASSKPPKVMKEIDSEVEEVTKEVERKKVYSSADEDFIAEVLAEEETAQTRSKRSTAARMKGPRKVTLVSLDDHNNDQTEAKLHEVPEANARVLTTASVRLSSKLSSQSYKDPLVLERVQRIQQLRQGRLEVELKRKEAADRARMLIANAERAAKALEEAGKVDPATLATLREARRVLTEATRSVQAAESKPGASRRT